MIVGQGNESPRGVVRSVKPSGGREAAAVSTSPMVLREHPMVKSLRRLKGEEWKDGFVEDF